MKILIFGSNGQDGYYLTKYLEEQGAEVIGISRSKGDIVGDVNDLVFVESLIGEHQPGYIFHFAANSTTKHDALFVNHQTIATGTLNILESVRLNCPACKVFLSGSAMQFKNEGLPIDESTQFDASSPYSVSRIHSVYAARYYRSAFGLKVYMGYFFNHDSPLRGENHVNQKIVAAVKRIRAGSTEKLHLGNINVRKEFNYAADLVKAVWILVSQDKVFEAVIGGGIAHSIKDWIEYCFNKINKDWEEFVVEDKNFIPEYSILVSNPALIKSLGWQPKVDFFELADLMMGKV